MLWTHSSTLLLSGERYPAAGSLFGNLRFEGIDVASASKDGRTLATGSEISSGGDAFTATISVTDRPSGRRRWRTELNTPEHFRSVNALLWSPDDQQVVSNDTDGDVTVLDAVSGKILKQLKVHTYRPCVFSFVPGGLLLTERDIKGGQTFLALRSWPALTSVWRVPLDCFDAATGNTDRSGTLAAIVLRDGRSVGLFDLRTHAFRQGVLRVPEPLTSDAQTALYSLSVQPDGRGVAGGLRNGAVLVWDVPSGQVRWQLHAHGDLVRALSWNAASDALASSAFGGCGWLRSECVVVTRFGGTSPTSKVVWHRRFDAADSVMWLNRSTLLLSENDQVFTVSSGLPDR
ncbi:WD40 repeat domain-containing protein [Deinococcus altitudinis]|uniref:WD40 repeat domain-containing protein n=1 Tax=Deinococcus altitudinis TaxID=468914 RepID=UPI003892157D